MTVTPTDFVSKYAPEYASTLAADGRNGTAIVQQALTDAAAGVDYRLFPATIADRMVALIAADMLATSPYGQQARLDSGDKKKPAKSTYRVEYEELEAKYAGGPVAMGQPAVPPAILPGWNPLGGGW